MDRHWYNMNKDKLLTWRHAILRVYQWFGISIRWWPKETSLRNSFIGTDAIGIEVFNIVSEMRIVWSTATTFAHNKKHGFNKAKKSILNPIPQMECTKGTPFMRHQIRPPMSNQMHQIWLHSTDGETRHSVHANRGEPSATRATIHDHHRLLLYHLRSWE